MNWPLEVQGLLVGQSEALPFWGVSYIWKKDDGYLCGSVLVHKKVSIANSWLMIGRMGQSGFHLPDSSFVLEKSGGETNCD